MEKLGLIIALTIVSIMIIVSHTNSNFRRDDSAFKVTGLSTLGASHTSMASA